MRVKSKHDRRLKFLSILFLAMIFIGVSTAFFLSIPERVEVKAKFVTISIYPSGGSYRLCLIYNVTNPRSYKVQVYVTLDLRDANIGVTVGDVIYVLDDKMNTIIRYESVENYVIKFVLELSANEARTIVVLL
ncbi:MAG: hypothetical protein QXX09_01085 [Candidatus Methanomethylicia archaeon]